MKKQIFLYAALTLLAPSFGEALVDEIWCDYPCGINPSLPPCQGCGFTAELSYLYWKPFQDNNEWAYLETPKDNNAANFESIGEFFKNNKIESQQKDVKYDWDSGFKVTFGIDVPCFFWNLGMTWTHYDTDIKATANSNQGALIPAFLQNTPITYPANITVDQVTTQGDALWTLRFNQLDFDCNKEFLFGYGVTLTPYIGVRSLFLKETYRIHTELTQLDVGNETDKNTYDIRTAFDFKSFGLKAGLKTHYELFCGLSFYGDITLSSVYGQLEANYLLEAAEFVDDVRQGTPAYHLKEDHNCLRTAADLDFGLEWRTLTNCDSGMFYVRLGWEHHTLFNQNNFLSASAINSNQTNAYYSGLVNQMTKGGNLYLYGWVFSLGARY